MNKKLTNIVHITNNFTPYTGGVTKAIETITHGLRSKGIRVTIITLDFTGDSYGQEIDVIRLPTVGKLIYKNNHIALPINPTQAIYAALERIQPDLIHLHHPFLLGNSGLICAQKLTIPTVFTYHTLYHTYAHYVPLPTWFTKIIIAKRMQKLCNQVDGIFAPSTYAKKLIDEHAHPNKTVLLPSPISHTFFLPEASHKSITEPIELLYVGRFVPEKNLFALIDLYTLLPKKKFRLTCVGYGYLEQELKNYAYRKNGLSPENIRFVIRPVFNELLALYRSSHLFLFTSQTDTQGLVLAEAMAQGVPVVALPGPGQSDLIKTGFNGIIGDSITLLAQSIKDLGENQALYTSLSMNAYQSSFAYHPESYIDKILTCYKNIVYSHRI